MKRTIFLGLIAALLFGGCSVPRITEDGFALPMAAAAEDLAAEQSQRHEAETRVDELIEDTADTLAGLIDSEADSRRSGLDDLHASLAATNLNLTKVSQSVKTLPEETKADIRAAAAASALAASAASQENKATLEALQSGLSVLTGKVTSATAGNQEKRDTDKTGLDTKQGLDAWMLEILMASLLGKQWLDSRAAKKQTVASDRQTATLERIVHGQPQQGAP